MRNPPARLGDWLDARTGFRAHRRHLLDEPLPPGTGWWFVTGSVVLFLLAVQSITGIGLAMYYVPAPELAHESVRFINERLSFGSTLRGLHVFGASFIIIAAVIHLLRVVVTASYKSPRELTWITGIVLLLTILGFALTGYLLPWDQKAYWATTVTINVVRSTPGGEWIADVLRGGATLGAMTLLRWYVVHVFLLPAGLLAFTIAHLYLMRRHGISGPATPTGGARFPFYPYHALRDTLACAGVFALLLTLAANVSAPLDAVADPTDASYVPRPEWYFLSLFQLLKHFPGALEPIATIVLPGLLLVLLVLLPFLDRNPERDPRRRRPVLTAFAVCGLGLAWLTYLGHRDTPEPLTSAGWGLLPIAGHELAKGEDCVRCHRPGGTAGSLEETPVRRDPEWLRSHIRDPEVIAPGIRPAPRGGMTLVQAELVLSSTCVKPGRVAGRQRSPRPKNAWPWRSAACVPAATRSMATAGRRAPT